MGGLPAVQDDLGVFEPAAPIVSKTNAYRSKKNAVDPHNPKRRREASKSLASPSNVPTSKIGPKNKPSNRIGPAARKAIVSEHPRRAKNQSGTAIKLLSLIHI